MAKKKQARTYSAAELRDQLIPTLEANKQRLSRIVSACTHDVTFDEAVTIRDAAQYLVTTCLTIGHVKDTIIQLAEYRGPMPVAYLEDCGLDWVLDSE